MSSNGGKGRLGFAVSRQALVWLAAVVVVLVVVDVLLVTVALGRTAPGDNGRAAPIPTFSSVPTATPTATPTARPSASASATATPTPSATGTPAAAGGGQRRFLSAVSASELWRATSGSCTGGDAVVERSTDGGATWKPTATGQYDVHTVAGIVAGSVKTSIVAGTGADCTETELSSYTDGAYWAADSAALVSDYVTSDSRIHLSSGTAPSPCAAPTQILTTGSTTAVVCPGVLAVRQSAADDWVQVPVSGLVAATDTGSGFTLARTGRSTCDGVEVDTLTTAAAVAASKPTHVGCAPATTTSGAVAIVQTDDRVAVWSGSQVLTSTDGGTTW
ncbi:hypothetical protein DEI93_02665 [Curtobacterium sp. MCBD17_035]|uniref:hypothetical protein n=1 Tax=Curtobacterium sp. MCBD17_035 TaxID=2175673 RepID=UPI000DAA9743|nr:hypothetical protein [Curtobacterium sp. MCBD17_035]WIB67963.1 hypothetical protein DEI93_02665 [Curtobacterium sp. MCBD17_035]